MLPTQTVDRLPNIGAKRAALYEKLGVRTIDDLLRHYPRDYEDWSRPLSLADAQPGTACCIGALALEDAREKRIRQGMTIYRFRVSDGQSTATVTLFNDRFTAARVRRGEDLLLFGEVVAAGRQYTMTAPRIESAAAGQRIHAIYPRTEGLSDRMIAANVRTALDTMTPEAWPDVLPDELRARLVLPDIRTALHDIHFPPDRDALEKARTRLCFEELYVLQAGLLRLRGRDRHAAGAVLREDHTEAYAAMLPFTLTGAQRRAIDDCVRDMRTGRPMNRLVQGDVGSGKTAVAAGAAYGPICEGWQAALMAPTEILARQHAETLQHLLGEQIRVGLLTGAVPAAARRQLTAAVAAGQIDLLVGTNALLSDDVHFARLGLVITDEQHRFGVRQRARLAEKGIDPHLLVMSATPIPRTLALIVYGDLDVSVLDELPPGRQPIQTFAVSSRRRERAYAYVRQHLDAGQQGYVVCPLVEESEESAKSAAETVFRELADGPFAGYRLGLLHGRMRPAEKDAVMTAFAAGQIDLLVSTTVIEVGVDVPNAVIMVIEDADRFGLAQLHQLRGRVGRGRVQSTCILISDSTGEDSRRRLQVMCATTDGFRIADEDLKLRGPGDFFGDRQHGLPPLRLADLSADMPLLRQAQAAAANTIECDPDLSAPEHAALASAVRALFSRVGASGLN